MTKPSLSIATLRGVRIGFIGAGTMGQALVKGLLAHGLSRSALGAADARGQARHAVRRRLRIWTTPDNAALVRRSDVVILAVKPQQFPAVVPTLAPALRGRLAISIAAGITLGWLRKRLPGVPLVRVMPNLPATVGCGFAGIAAARGTTQRHRRIVQAIFGSVGIAVELPERHLNAITAVSGSGPAYVFFLVEAWEWAAQQLGLPASVAAAAVRQTLEGSTRLLAASGDSPASLIRKVASKRGTTEAALTVLARRRVAAHVIEALRAAARRARKLSI